MFKVQFKKTHVRIIFTLINRRKDYDLWVGTTMEEINPVGEDTILFVLSHEGWKLYS
jgi:hypothetical protein